LQVAAEQGIVGLSIFLLLIGSFLLKFLKASADSFPVRAAFASLVGLLVACFFGGHLLSFEASILFWFLLTYPYEHHQRNKKHP
jgi:O-antigen ligase